MVGEYHWFPASIKMRFLEPMRPSTWCKVRITLMSTPDDQQECDYLIELDENAKPKPDDKGRLVLRPLEKTDGA